MKVLKESGCLILALSTLIIGGVGCSTVKSVTGVDQSAEKIATQGPSVLNSRVNPGTVEMTSNLTPRQNVEIMAEVKDFKSNITDVRVKFKEVPLELKMKNIGGSTWHANVSPSQLKRLAVGNQTTVYKADVYAKDSAGKTGVSQKPLEIAIKVPDLSQKIG